MTPGNYCYLDHYQSYVSGEPAAFGAFTPLEEAYSYNSIPTELTEEDVTVPTTYGTSSFELTWTSVTTKHLRITVEP